VRAVDDQGVRRSSVATLSVWVDEAGLTASPLGARTAVPGAGRDLVPWERTRRVCKIGP